MGVARGYGTLRIKLHTQAAGVNILTVTPCSARYRISCRAPRINQVIALDQVITLAPDQKKKTTLDNYSCKNSGCLPEK